MPANLPPEYFKAEEKYHQARTLEEKIQATRELIRVAPKHKGSERLLKTLKRRLAKLKDELERQKTHRRGGGGGPSFQVKREGAAQVVLVGMPNSGKSTLIKSLTRAEPEVGDYPFTTTLPVPGMMDFEDIQIQLVEVPAVVEGSSEGRGLGGLPLSVARNADLIALVIDVSGDVSRQAKTLTAELEASGVRLNLKPPKVTITRRSYGGIEIYGTRMFRGGETELKDILRKWGISNALVVLEEEVDARGLETILDESSVYRRAFFLLTKCDIGNWNEKLKELKRKYPKFSVLSAKEHEKLKEGIFNLLEIIRIYTKRPGEEPSKPPMILRRGSTVLDAARAVHRDFAEELKFVRVWGSSRFPGQQVPHDYVLQDGDIVEFRSS